MSTLVDTSVWSSALRRDHPRDIPELEELKRSLASGGVLYTGLILQELLQGFSRPKARRQIIDRFSSLPLIAPNREDHIDDEFRSRSQANRFESQRQELAATIHARVEAERGSNIVV